MCKPQMKAYTKKAPTCTYLRAKSLRSLLQLFRFTQFALRRRRSEREATDRLRRLVLVGVFVLVFVGFGGRGFGFLLCVGFRFFGVVRVFVNVVCTMSSEER